jgi:hypothetical protein
VEKQLAADLRDSLEMIKHYDAAMQIASHEIDALISARQVQMRNRP